MGNLQEQLIRANAIARLGRIVDALEHRQPLSSDERRWFAELLYAVASNEAGSARLVASSAVSRAEGSALLAILREEIAKRDVSALEAYVRQLANIRNRLLVVEEKTTLDGPLLTSAVDVAQRLRRHFLGAESPVNPRLASWG